MLFDFVTRYHSPGPRYLSAAYFQIFDAFSESSRASSSFRKAYRHDHDAVVFDANQASFSKASHWVEPCFSISSPTTYHIIICFLYLLISSAPYHSTIQTRDWQKLKLLNSKFQL